MDGGLPLLNCLWQQALRSFCSSDSANSSKWVYAVFWRILPRNYPPPRWDDGQGAFNRSNGNKRNWILVWEDGFCDFCECEHAVSALGKGKFGPDVFFKMSHEVYNYGEGLMGKVAADNSHKWISKEIPSETDPNFFSSWNGSLDPQPKAWETQFNSGIQTIAIVAVREGVIQLGSFDKVAEDLNLVISIQRRFNYLQSIPGVFAMQRPFSAPLEHYTSTSKHNLQMSEMLRCGMRVSGEKHKESPSKSNNLGCNTPRYKSIFGSNPPLLPPMSYSLEVLLSKLPCVIPSNCVPRPLSSADDKGFDGSNTFSSFDRNSDVKPNIFGVPEGKPRLISPYSRGSNDETSLQMQRDEQGNATQFAGECHPLKEYYF